MMRCRTVSSIAAALALLSAMVTSLPAAPPPATPARVAATQRAAATYENPLDVLVADPFVLRQGKTYYLYGTAGPAMGCPVWTSNDLVNWRSRGYAFRRTRETWSRRHFWAPEAFEHHGKFYLHFTAGNEQSSQRIILSESDSPVGPFREIKAPWFASDKAVIDSHVFRDDDGQLYLYYVLDCSENGDSEIYVRRLSDDLVPSEETHFCAKPSQPWEGSTWNEGPFVLKHEGTYYLFYSANVAVDSSYSVGYAMASSPLGPWKKSPDNPILQRRGSISGPGHNSVIDSPDHRELFIVYHTHQQPTGNSWLRQLAIDRMRFVPSQRPGEPDHIEVLGPTETPQPLPSGATPFARARDDEFSEDSLDRNHWLIFSEDQRDWSLRDGKLLIIGRDGDVANDRADLSNLFLQYAPAGNFSATTRLQVDPKADFEQAFLILWEDHNHFLKFGSVWSKGGPQIELGVERDGKYAFTLTKNTWGEDLYLRLTRRGQAWTAQVSADGRRWTTISERIQLELDDLRVGLGACSPVSTRPVEAQFDFIRFDKPLTARSSGAASHP